MLASFILKIVFDSLLVLGEPCIIPNTIVTLTIKFHAVFPNQPEIQIDSKIINDDDEVEAKWWEDTTLKMKDVYAPFFPQVK